MTSRLLTLPLAAAAASLLLACSPQDRAEVKADASKAATATGNAAERAADATGKAASQAGAEIKENVSDVSITSKVKSALLADDQVKGLKINVDTANQIVTLTGEANSDATKQRAEQLALQVDGVKSVQNNINVGAAKGGATKGTKG